MSRFLTPLRAELVEDSDPECWRLLEALEYQSDRHEFGFVVPAGFVTDFASVPRLPLAYLLAGDTAHAPAALHDWLYGRGDARIDRAAADRLFVEAMAAIHVPRWRRALMYWAVRIFGYSAWRERARRC